MAVTYTQTDTNPALTVSACSGATVGTAVVSRTCTAGGTAGSSAFTCGGTAFDSGLVRALAMFVMTPAAGTAWGAGNVDIKLNVTSAAGNAGTQWTATYVCRLNSSDVSQATMGSLTGQTTAMNSTGVKTHTVNLSSQTPSAGDKVYVVCVFTAGANNQQFNITPNQDLVFPFTVPTAFDRSLSDGLAAPDAYARVGIGKRAFSDGLAAATPGFSAREVRQGDLPEHLTGPADAYARTSVGNRTYFDGLGLQDAASLVRAGAALIAVAEALGLADAYARTSTGLRPYSDGPGLTDAFARTSTGNRPLSDPLGLADAATPQHIAAGALTVAVAEALGLLTPGFSAREIRQGDLPEHLAGLQDVYARASIGRRPLADSLGLQDAYARASVGKRALSDLLALATPGFELGRITDLSLPAEALGLQDVASLLRAGAYLLALSDALGLADAYARVGIGNRAFSDGQGHQDVYARRADALRAASDPLALPDAYARAGVGRRSLSDTPGLVDAYARASVGKRALSDLLGLTDALLLTGAGLRIIVVAEALGLLDQYGRAAGASRSLSGGLAPADVFARTAGTLRALADTLAAPDAFQRRADTFRATQEAVGLPDAHARVAGGERHLSDFLGLADLADLSLASALSAYYYRTYVLARRG